MHLQENRVSPNSTRFAHPSSEVNMCFYFLKQKSNNSAPFPVYKPPTTLPGMVSGQKEEKKKASGQIDKAVWTNTLSTNTENGGLGETAGWGRGVHLSKQAAEEHEEALVHVNYGRSQTYTERGSQHWYKRKGLLSWESDMPGGKEARTEVWPWFYSHSSLKCGKTSWESPSILSAAVLHICKHTQRHTHACAHTSLPVPNKDHII